MLSLISTVSLAETEDYVTLLQFNSSMVPGLDTDLTAMPRTHLEFGSDAFQSTFLAQHFQDSTFQPYLDEKSHGSPGSVLYIVKTFSGNYDTRLEAAKNTWMSQIAPQDVVVLGDKPHDSPKVITFDDCPNETHFGELMPLACRETRALEHAAHLFAESDRWSWVFIADDDHYVISRNVEDTLAQWDASQPIAGGCFGCGDVHGLCDGTGGFCGACGIAISRAALVAMVGTSSEEYHAFCEGVYMDEAKSQGRDDTTVGCVIKDRVKDLEIKTFTRGNITAGVIDASKMGELEFSKLTPLNAQMVAHWVTPEQMYKIHEKVG
jgi:hypothetical protein